MQPFHCDEARRENIPRNSAYDPSAPRVFPHSRNRGIQTPCSSLTGSVVMMKQKRSMLSSARKNHARFARGRTLLQTRMSVFLRPTGGHLLRGHEIVTITN